MVTRKGAMMTEESDDALAWIIHERSLCQSDGLKWTVAARGGVDE